MIDLPMMDGAMQDYALTLDKFLHHAAKWHPHAEVVTAREHGRDRIGYADLRTRSLAVSGLLAGFGVRQGDRVATLAWNTQAHVEAWYAIMGLGAVCHTLNPRLTGAQLAAMVVPVRRPRAGGQRRPAAPGPAHRGPSAEAGTRAGHRRWGG
ncbi:AMP-binding protein [Nitrospirillum sp. BR 11163]|uniref:AMP-binding protein n=1 Tax=Nitrospirillum sp. BR 11163 TaxID=3104323 RepID=UPI002B002438|nr:AMP-binding protein [Nitrospirillum sp. BR 11163]MEA1672412.1 AMP-binding protein [Nitrospirillum sp. BR 11163]